MRTNAGTEEQRMLLEDFEVWLKTSFTEKIRVKGHIFEKNKTENILVDGALFNKEEAKQLFFMITSNNLFSRLNATLLIWEKRGILTIVLIVSAILALVLVYIRVKR